MKKKFLTFILPLFILAPTSSKADLWGGDVVVFNQNIGPSYPASYSIKENCRERQ